jgi:hypothetical protein
MESSRPAKEADVVVLGAVEVLLEGTTSSLRRVSCPPVGLSFCSCLVLGLAALKYSPLFGPAWDRGDTSESGLRAARGDEDASFPFLFSAIAGGNGLVKSIRVEAMPARGRSQRETSRGYLAIARIEDSCGSP